MNSIAWKYGAILFAVQLVLFFLLRLTGLHDINTLVIISAIVQAVVEYLAIREYRISGKSRAGNYLSGVLMGMYVITIGVSLFTVAAYFYLLADPGYVRALEEDAAIGDQQEFVNPTTLTFNFFAVGWTVGIIGSYIITRIIDMNLAHTNTNVNSPK
ncbi:MAG: DUF4199 domain-containing protein [Saprospiraceae bacterium]